MSGLSHLFSSEKAELYGLPAAEWQVAVDRCKTPFGRRVVVGVRHVTTGRELTDTEVGSRLTKRDLDKHAERMVIELAVRLGFQKPATGKSNPSSKRRRRRHN